jgi:hypothetical protein
VNNRFFERPILNSPYEYPSRHWELDDQGQPTQQIIERRRRVSLITPIPKPRKRKTTEQRQFVFDEGKGLSTAQQQYDPTPIINELRRRVDQWRGISNPSDWRVTPETARLLQHWRHHPFNSVRPFFCQVEAVETAIWLTEVAPNEKAGSSFLEHLAIVVCNNTSISKLVYDYISGFHRENEDGSTTLENGRLALFRNFDEHGNPLARPNTLLIDSEQLESGDALDENFRNMARDEIERFRNEIFARGGKLADELRMGKELDDVTLLREVVNTVGKYVWSARRVDPLRGFSRDADRGLGRQHRHARARRARLRHAAAVRAGHRSRAAPAVLQSQ